MVAGRGRGGGEIKAGWTFEWMAADNCNVFGLIAGDAEPNGVVLVGILTLSVRRDGLFRLVLDQ